MHVVSNDTRFGCGKQTMIRGYWGAQGVPRKHSPHHCTTATSSLDCWPKGDWVHGFMMFTPNSDPAICEPQRNLRSDQTTFFQSVAVRFWCSQLNLLTYLHVLAECVSLLSNVKIRNSFVCLWEKKSETKKREICISVRINFVMVKWSVGSSEFGWTSVIPWSSLVNESLFFHCLIQDACFIHWLTSIHWIVWTEWISKGTDSARLVYKCPCVCIQLHEKVWGFPGTIYFPVNS